MLVRIMLCEVNVCGVERSGKDKVVLPSNSDDMVAKLRELKYDVKYSRIDGVGHNVWEYAYNEELINWLLSHKK